MKKVAVLGWYGHRNIGDEAYKLAFAKLFPDYKLEFTNCLTGPATTIILGGGDVINPFFINQISRYTTADKYAFSVSTTGAVEPYLKLFKKIVSRDKDVPDFTFALDGDAKRGKMLIEAAFAEAGAELYERLVVITMNTFLCQGEAKLARDHVNFDRVCFELSKIIDSTSASFLFLPFGNGFPTHDVIANGILYSRCKFWKKNLLWMAPLEVQDALDICAAANAVVGTRLHSLIFSCIGGTPFISISHHDKTTSFLKTIGHEDWNIDYWRFDSTKLDLLLNDFLIRNGQYKDLVGYICKSQKEKLASADLALQSNF
jgi:hypothetical protein